MYELILSNGDQAEAETSKAVALAVRTLEAEAREAGYSLLTARLLWDGVCLVDGVRPRDVINVAVRHDLAMLDS